MNYAQPEYAVGWTTLALINGGLAQSKGRAGGIWFLFSLLLGPVPVAIDEQVLG